MYCIFAPTISKSGEAVAAETIAERGKKEMNSKQEEGSVRCVK